MRKVCLFALSRRLDERRNSSPIESSGAVDSSHVIIGKVGSIFATAPPPPRQAPPPQRIPGEALSISHVIEARGPLAMYQRPGQDRGRIGAGSGPGQDRGRIGAGSGPHRDPEFSETENCANIARR
jgi:hypothetical protein